MILNNAENVHVRSVKNGVVQGKLPNVNGFFKRETFTRPDGHKQIDYVRTVTFVPGVKLLGYILLLVGGVTLVKPADGCVHATVRASSAALAALGIIMITWRRDTRYDLIVAEQEVG